MALNNNVRMLIVNEVDNATAALSVGTEVATLPLSNVQLYSNAKIFRSMDIAQVQITLVWSEPRIISGVALNRHNMSEASTWQIERFSDQAMTLLINDSGELSAVEQKTLGELEFLIDPLVAAVSDTRYQTSDYWFEDEAVQAVRITLKDPNNEFGFIDLTRLYIGRVFQPDVNFDFGHKFGWESKTKPRRTAGGTLYAKKAARPRNFHFELRWLTESDRPHFVNAVQITGDDTDWYISMFPNVGGQKERQYAMSCVFKSLPDLTGAFYNNYQTSIAIEEA